MPSFDEVLQKAGEFGRFQRRVFLLMCLTGITFAFLFVSVVFLGISPHHHWCRGPSAAALAERCGWSPEEEWNLTAPAASAQDLGARSDGRCERYELEAANWSSAGDAANAAEGALSCSDPLAFFPNRTAPLVPCRDNWKYSQSYPSIVSEFNMVCLDSWMLDFTQAVLNLGFLAGAFTLCYAADRVVPESPRWLITRKKGKKALKILQSIAKYNGKYLSPTYSEITVTDEEVSNPSFLDLVRTPQMRKCTLILMYAWFTSAVVYQGLVMRLGIIGGNLYIDFFISGVVELPGALLILLTIECIGRRLPFAASNIVAGIACLVTAFLPEGIPWLRTTVATIGRLGITMAFEIVYLVNSELYPTTLRNFGVSLCSGLCDFGGIVAPFLLFRLSAIWLELPLIIFGILASVCGGLVMLLPETKGIALPETVEEVEKLASPHL
uniref:Solute carrier family 22 member 3 n=1 Tax=Monodelphis domestica TaxID=13616 RepID=A0A5F8GY92_MONDO